METLRILFAMDLKNKTASADYHIIPKQFSLVIYFQLSKVFVTYVNQLCQHNLLRTITDIVHASNPFHLIGSLEHFCNTLCLRHLAHKLFHHRLSLLVHICQMRPQFTGDAQSGQPKKMLKFEYRWK